MVLDRSLYVNLLQIVNAVVLLPMISAYGAGAGSDACTTLKPGHGLEPQSSSHPFSLTVSSSTYCPGDTVTVKLNAIGASKIEGFLLQPQIIGSNNVPQGGSWLEKPDKSKYLCDGSSSITHSEKLGVTTLSAVWRAPSTDVGKITFMATVVENYSTFWMGIHSYQMVFAPSCPTSSTSSTTTATASSSTTQAASSMAPTSQTTTLSGGQNDDDIGNGSTKTTSPSGVAAGTPDKGQHAAVTMKSTAIGIAATVGYIYAILFVGNF